MKKHLLNGLAILASMFAMEATAQTRFIDPVFAGVTKTSNVMYDSNASVNILYGQVPGIQPLFSHKLKCDIYEPSGDAAAKRPLIILTYTGSFLPVGVNKQPTGSKTDSSIVEIATQLAMRGYVVVPIEYRSGWNPLTTDQAQATEQLLKATYRGMQDVRNAIRFFRANAATYKIDTSMIVVGGQGTGGYIAYAVATVSKRGDIENNLKFQRGDASPMVSMDTLGDWTGLGGWAPLNYGADAAVSSNAHMTFNWGGAMGDSAWMKPTSLPMVSLQVVSDIFAPYYVGNVNVPNGPTVIPNASGAGHVIPIANKMGINAKLNTVMYVDPVSGAAMAGNGGVNNLFGFKTTPFTDNAPWEWWNRTYWQAVTAVPYAGSPLAAPLYGFIPANGRQADSLSMLTNPTMNAAKGKAYCDTVVRFVTPRIAIQFDIAGDKTLNAFDLVSPANNAFDTVLSTSTDFVVAKWQKSHVVGAASGSTTYNFEMDMANGNFSAPLYTIPVVDGDTLAMPKAFLYAQLPGPDGSVYPLKWRVVARNANFGRVSISANNVTLVKGKVGGVSNQSMNAYVSVFPNPAKDQLNITMDNSKAPMSSMTVVDLMGREVMSVNNLKTNEYSLNTSGLNSGVYFVNIKTINGESATKRFVIQ